VHLRLHSPLGNSQLLVFNLATGTRRTWSFKLCGQCSPSSGGLGFGGMNADALSWTADGRHLAFVAPLTSTATVGPGSSSYTPPPVRLLDVSAPGPNLLANSKVVLTWPHGAGKQLGPAWRGVIITPDGRTTDPRARNVIRHAQRVAEGKQLQIHRNTWRYNHLIEHQRQLILQHRDRVLRTDAALRSLAAHRPDRYRQLRGDVEEPVLVKAARQIVLYHLDRAWVDHLAVLAEIREGIHLRALGLGLDPLAEFHAEAVPLYHRLLDKVEKRSAQTFQEVAITADGADLASVGLQRPTATWTYLVRDNPFGSPGERVLRSLFGG